MLRFGETHRGDRCWVIFESRRSTPHLGVVESRTLLFLHTLRGRILLTKSSYGGGTNHVAIRARSRFQRRRSLSTRATIVVRHFVRASRDTHQPNPTHRTPWLVRARSSPLDGAGASHGRTPRARASATAPRRDVVEIQAPFPRGDASVYALRGRHLRARR